MRLALSLGALALLAPALSAQLTQTESLTNFTHVGTAPNWTDDLPNSDSRHGIVDRLNSIDNLQYVGQTMMLQPGTYVFSARLMKIQDQVGVADIQMIVIASGPSANGVLPASAQPTDTWVQSPYLSVSITQAQPVTVVLQNTDTTVLKQNYLFDEVTVGRVELGPLVHYSSMTDWPHAWGNDPRYFAGPVADPDSADGRAEHLLGVWWLEFMPLSVSLPPGLYTANVRLKKIGSASGASDVDLEVRLPAGSSRVTLTGIEASQALGTYVHTPDVIFTVNQGDTPDFWFGNTQSTYKSGYHFDALIVRRGSFIPYGTGCRSSLGEVALSGTTPVIGEPYTQRVRNVPAAGGALAFGAASAQVDLTGVGMPGCTMWASFDAIAPLVAGPGGIAEFSLLVPVNVALAGSELFSQALVFDPGINALGIAASNGARARISP
jgi:hypothetical protein